MQSHLVPLLTEQILSASRGCALSLLFTVIFWSSVSRATTDDYLIELQQIAQLAEYIGVDYSEAVKDGRVIDVGEYQEMVEFSGIIIKKASLIVERSENFQTVAYQAESLRSAIEKKQQPNAVQDLAAALRHTVLALAPLSSLPSALVRTAKSKTIFENSCATCHGMAGRGDGFMAEKLAPSPTDFTNKARALNRSVLGLYDAVANGIEGTAMPSFPQLSEQEKWSLAFYVGGIAFQSSEQFQPQVPPVVSLEKLVNYSPSQLAKGLPTNQKKAIERLRANPNQLFAANKSPLAVTRERLEAALKAYHSGDYDMAHNLAVSAYLDGFELIETNLDARNQTLRKSIENTLIRLRRVISQPENKAELEIVMSDAFDQLNQAEKLLAETTLSSGTLFSVSLVILLREGLEALLVIIALITVLRRTHRQDALMYVHLGWIAALLAGGATWLAAQSLISISGASREVMEGVAAMLAAIVLFYVGIWMHNKSDAAQWQAYIQQHINTKLQSGTLWGLAALAFVAVYREVFETVLFYQSLLTQAVDTQYLYIAGGFLLGTVILFALAWVLIKYSIKLPIARFFTTTTYLLLALSFVLMGKAISALQEAAVISISSMPVNFSIEWIGVNSTWQGVLAQTSIILAFVILNLRARFMRHNKQEAT